LLVHTIRCNLQLLTMPTPSLILVPARFKTGKLYTPVATTSGGLVLGASGDFNVTRATTATRVNASGLIESVASGIPRLDYPIGGGCPSLLIEPAATNLALHSRDLTNAVWSGTTVTTAKNAVGADGTASGATTITATAASGTVLQALSHASQSRVFSAYIRRVTGTGAIQLTTNGGTNWTTVTITSGYTQVACAAQTVASGTVGIRLAVSGDVIEVDFTQGELGPVATSPIPNTAGTGTRNAEVISISGAVSGCIGQTEGTMYLDFIFRRPTIATAGPCGIASSNNQNRVLFWNNNSTNSMAVNIQVNGANIFNTPVGTLTEGTRYKLACAYKSGDSAIFLNGVQVGNTNTSAFTFSTSLVSIFLGTYEAAAASVTNTGINAFTLYTTRLTNTELAALTA
jgi:hypothetical protein